MGKVSSPVHSETRQHLLHAALKTFAERGYAAASVQDIVDAAQVSKPALYYYFGDKAGLFKALVHQAHEERYQLLMDAAARGKTLAEKLESILTALIDYSVQHQELMRLAFTTTFSTNGEGPGHEQCRIQSQRNFEVVRAVFEQARKDGEADRRFSAEDLAMAFYGQVDAQLMVRVLMPHLLPHAATARRIVQIFLQGAAPKTTPNAN